MTVKECYSQMGGDYNNVLSRFYDEAMIKRLLGRFIDHTSFRALEQAMTEGDTQAAFNAAHTLRGVCQSLSFTQLCGTLDSITEALRGGLSARELVEQVLSEFQLEILSEEPVEYRCGCSRDRIERALLSLGRDELSAILAEQGSCDLTCQFCDRVYHFSGPELEGLIQSLEKKD